MNWWCGISLFFVATKACSLTEKNGLQMYFRYLELKHYVLCTMRQTHVKLWIELFQDTQIMIDSQNMKLNRNSPISNDKTTKPRKYLLMLSSVVVIIKISSICSFFGACVCVCVVCVPIVVVGVMRLIRTGNIFLLIIFVWWVKGKAANWFVLKKKRTSQLCKIFFFFFFFTFFFVAHADRQFWQFIYYYYFVFCFCGNVIDCDSKWRRRRRTVRSSNLEFFFLI